MIQGAQKQVNPRVAAAILIAVLAVVQWFWYKGLLSKPAPVVTPQQGGGPIRMPPFSLMGEPAVQVDTLAGSPDPGFVDGPGHRARFDAPVAIALAPDGALLVADSRNHRIRRLTTTGQVTTVAGSSQGSADGPAAQATFSYPCGVAVAPDGTIYVADAGNHRIRRIRDGQVTTLAGSTQGMADGAGSAAKFDTPIGTALAADGALLVADSGNGRVRRVTAAGVVGGAVPMGAFPTVAVARPLGPIPVETPAESGVKLALKQPIGYFAGPGGTYVIDAAHNGIFVLRDGKAHMVAGFARLTGPLSNWLDGTGARARFSRLSGVVADGRGHVYVCDTGNNAIRRLTLPGASDEKEAAH